ncbi:MAG: hypothetical protein HY549_01470 [Elusimicrobia bacterium]|nr:hypothetical protein [Elusimicrobiota bacterium]
MRSVTMAITLGLILTPVYQAWSQHEGHGGMGAMPMSDPVADAKREAESRMNKLTKLQDKIDAVEQQLEDKKLAPKKRLGLEKKLKKLYEKKDQLLAEGHGNSHKRHHAAAPAVDNPAAETPCAPGSKCAGEATYICSMGDYSGPMTKDGRCPKCGMTLQKK